MIRRCLVGLAVTAVLMAGCGGGDDSAEQTATTTTASTVANKPGFDPANPQTVLVPIPGFTYRDLTKSEDAAMRREFEQQPAAIKAAFKGFVSRVARSGGKDVALLTVFGLDPQLAALPDFRRDFLDAPDPEAASSEPVTLAGEPATRVRLNDGTYEVDWLKGALFLTVSGYAKGDQAGVERIATALIASNK